MYCIFQVCLFIFQVTAGLLYFLCITHEGMSTVEFFPGEHNVRVLKDLQVDNLVVHKNIMGRRNKDLIVSGSDVSSYARWPLTELDSIGSSIWIDMFCMCFISVTAEITLYKYHVFLSTNNTRFIVSLQISIEESSGSKCKFGFFLRFWRLQVSSTCIKVLYKIKCGKTNYCKKLISDLFPPASHKKIMISLWINYLSLKEQCTCSFVQKSITQVKLKLWPDFIHSIL